MSYIVMRLSFLCVLAMAITSAAFTLMEMAAGYQDGAIKGMALTLMLLALAPITRAMASDAYYYSAAQSRKTARSVVASMRLHQL